LFGLDNAKQKDVSSEVIFNGNDLVSFGHAIKQRMNSSESGLVSTRTRKMNRSSIHKLQTEGSKRKEKKTHIVVIVFVGRLTLSGRHFECISIVFSLESLASG